MRLISARSFAALAAALALPAFAIAQAPDRIEVTSGSPVNGKIVRYTKTEVTIEDKNNQAVPVPVNRIKKVSFGDEPRELSSARTGALGGQLEQALDYLTKVNMAEVRLDAVKQDIDYYRAYATAKLALMGTEDPTNAGKLLFAFLNANPESFHYFEAQELLGDIFLVLQRYEQAADAYAKVGQAPFPDYQMRARILQAKAARLQDKHQEALTLYEQVAAANVDTPEARYQKTLAQIGQAACLANLGKGPEGIKIVEDLIAKNDPTDADVFGPAYNALGACHLAAGNTKDALRAYLHTDLLFYTNSEAHAEALYHLATLWTQLNDANEATRARGLLKDRYGGSVWSRKGG